MSQIKEQHLVALKRCGWDASYSYVFYKNLEGFEFELDNAAQECALITQNTSINFYNWVTQNKLEGDSSDLYTKYLLSLS